MKVSRGFANGKLTEELLLGLRGLLHGHVNAPAGRDTARRGGSRGKKNGCGGAMMKMKMKMEMKKTRQRQTTEG